MKSPSFVPLFFYAVSCFTFIHADSTLFTTVNNINCNNLPFKINTTTVLDGSVDLSNCLDPFNAIFEVENDAIVDCGGHTIMGHLARGYGGYVFHVIDGAT